MQVTKLTPLSYCHGVIKAIETAKKASQNEKKPIYILGSIIHNRFIVEAFNNLGCITLDDKGKTRLELLDEIDEGTVIFTAHGVSPIVYQKAQKKGLNVIDATCRDVLKIHESYQKYLGLGYTCLYIGQKNHPEVEGVLGINEKIILIEKKEDLDKIEDGNIYISNQTTLSLSDVSNIYDYAQKIFTNPIIDNERCHATTNRQKALLNNNSDLCYIIGDKKSSNTKKLFEVSSLYVKTIMIENVMDINPLDLKEIKHVSISAGASTPKEIIDDCFSYLQQFDFNDPQTHENRKYPEVKL